MDVMRGNRAIGMGSAGYSLHKNWGGERQNAVLAWLGEDQDWEDSWGQCGFL
ncbi:Hypothetical protein Minf_2235 [Methylacidiphilum infernorum V4]|uniref:Uncharacterized protein n=1 Tax=Methylacidiphilum infernorum (isolate V4) TaxID=481448 RepID=B3DZV4_METI4|nr:Hypothetical protein Minf_2235 [Methylacidiphilum infernorum V4]